MYDSIKGAGYYSNRACCIVAVLCLVYQRLLLARYASLLLFLVTLVIYFFNLDMKFAAALIKPLTAYYNWSKNRREAKKKKEQDTHKE